MAKQSKEILAFVEKLGVFFGMENRMPRSVARVLALMLVSEPPHVTADDIAATLRMSNGSVSTAVNALVQVGLLKRVTFPGDRRYYYESDPAGWRQAMLMRLQSVHHGIALSKEGMKLAKDNPRLLAMHDTYKIFESEVETLIKRLDNS